MSGFRSSTTSRFWKLFAELPGEVQDLAFEKYELFKRDPYHPSLGFQAKGKVWTVDIGRSYRAIAFRTENHLSWCWIGSHEDYNTLILGKTALSLWALWERGTAKRRVRVFYTSSIRNGVLSHGRPN